MSAIQPELEKVAEALRDALAAGSFSKQFMPGITFDGTLELKDDNTLHVDIVPVQSPGTRNTRGSVAWNSTCDIGVRYKFGTAHDDDATGEILDRHVLGFIYLEQEIIQFLFDTPRLQNYSRAVMFGDPEVRAQRIPSHLTKLRQFTGILRVTYQTETEIA